MKKLLSILLLGFIQTVFSQGLSCATATTITTNNTYTITAISGTYQPGCTTEPTPAPTSGVWYKYTPATNGVLTISSDLPQNDGNTNSDETRVSVFTGAACGSLTCYAGSDDISSANYLSTLSTLPLAAGTTYYIQWDNAWGATLGFDFTFTFTAQTCMPINASSVTQTNITNTAFTANWTAAIGAPANYNIEYGAIGFTQGTGTVVSTSGNSITITPPTAGASYDYYIRSNCGATQSTWSGPFTVHLASILPYSTNFDTTASLYGVTTNGWSLSATAASAHTAPNYLFVNSTTTAATNAQLFTKALSIASNEIVTVTFYTRLGSAAGTPHTLKVYYNTTPSMTGATLVGTPLTISTGTYTQNSRSFSVPTSGIYYIIFSDETPIVAAATSLRFDTVATTSVLGTNETEISLNNIVLYPNPVSDVLNIRSNDKIKTVLVHDMSGRKIDVKLSGSTINVRSLESGTYIIDIETASGKSSQKFIKK